MTEEGTAMTGDSFRLLDGGYRLQSEDLHLGGQKFLCLDLDEGGEITQEDDELRIHGGNSCEKEAMVPEEPKESQNDRKDLGCLSAKAAIMSQLNRV